MTLQRPDGRPPTAPARRTLIPATPVRVEVPARPHADDAAPGTIRTARLLLRPLAPADREAYVDAVRLSRADLDRFAPLHKPGESDDALFDRQLQWCTSGLESGTAHRMVAVTDDGRIAGAFNLNAIVRGLEFKADITWWVSSPLAGRGLASEGIEALCRFALADLPDGLGLVQVNAWVRRDNRASTRIAQKLGFLRAGEERSYLQTGDEWTLHDLYIKRA